jgi:hypothetical protein
MIVASHQKGWKIITQRSHGLLAAMIAYQYDIDLPNEIMVPTLIAIAEHDDGTDETNQDKNLTDARAPRHFKVSDASRKSDIKQQENVMEIAASKSVLNALLTSLHLKFLYGTGKDSANKQLVSFMKQQEKDRKEYLKHLDIDKKYVDRLYHFVEWCDAFSLLICQDKIQSDGKKMEVSLSPDGEINQAFYKADKEITVEPWPFKNNTFKVFYEFKILEQLKFNSVEEFNKICTETPVQREEFIFSK